MQAKRFYPQILKLKPTPEPSPYAIGLLHHASQYYLYNHGHWSLCSVPTPPPDTHPEALIHCSADQIHSIKEAYRKPDAIPLHLAPHPRLP